ncbi:MAG: UDP-N-acetylmuramate--L-alanine ligase [Bdellovibrionaceae bacterium]|nr:UDP-N-acetylmuramate--L-alanine ligase [Pseudobdellovibrionaceae bacterium]
MIFKKTKFHFIGIGGIGMCGLAELLKNMGHEVSGSDLSENANTEDLKRKGVKVFIGHDQSHLGDVDVVVYSSAVKQDNPEWMAAKAKQIPVIPRAEALSEIMRSKRGIAVAGTHGKTTTTSLISSVFLHANLSPTIVVGGRFEKIGSTALLGDGEWMIAEADESDGSFHKLTPEIAIITNIDADHLDFYKTFENVQTSFLQFAQRIPFYGSVIICGDDKVTKKLFENYPKRCLFYGFSSENDFYLRGEKSEYDIYTHDRKTKLEICVGHMSLQVPGRHNALNALASFVAAYQCGISVETILAGLKNFQGVDRRFQYKGEVDSIKVYDDYGHHPTEVRAVLEAFKEKFPDKRLVTLFQPHRFSRTQSCWNEFINCFYLTDVLVLTDIYSGGEAPIPNINSKRLYDEIKIDRKFYLPNSSSKIESLKKILKPGDIFLTLGAGDNWKTGMSLLGPAK